jgi:hypothetical protein
VIATSAKEIVDACRATEGYLGVAIFSGDACLFNENVDAARAGALLRLLGLNGGASRAAAAINGVTLTAFRAGGYAVVLEAAGRFPGAPAISLQDPEFAGPVPADALPSRGVARREAEAALRSFGLLP